MNYGKIQIETYKRRRLTLNLYNASEEAAKIALNSADIGSSLQKAKTPPRETLTGRVPPLRKNNFIINSDVLLYES